MINVKELYNSIYRDYEKDIDMSKSIVNASAFKFGNLWIEKRNGVYLVYKANSISYLYSFNKLKKFERCSSSTCFDKCYQFKYLEDALEVLGVCQL